MNSMNKILAPDSDLVKRLGEDTSTLAFRAGMHSGSVTAGVLRGAKARFQIFVSQTLALAGLVAELSRVVSLTLACFFSMISFSLIIEG